jgi:hypothetical protein
VTPLFLFSTLLGYLFLTACCCFWLLSPACVPPHAVLLLLARQSRPADEAALPSLRPAVGSDSDRSPSGSPTPSSSERGMALPPVFEAASPTAAVRDLLNQARAEVTDELELMALIDEAITSKSSPKASPSSSKHRKSTHKRVNSIQGLSPGPNVLSRKLVVDEQLYNDEERSWTRAGSSSSSSSSFADRSGHHRVGARACVRARVSE